MIVGQPAVDATDSTLDQGLEVGSSGKKPAAGAISSEKAQGVDGKPERNDEKAQSLGGRTVFGLSSDQRLAGVEGKTSEGGCTTGDGKQATNAALVKDSLRVGGRQAWKVKTDGFRAVGGNHVG